MNKYTYYLLSVIFLSIVSCEEKIAWTVSSPDGAVEVKVSLDQAGTPTYSLRRGGQLLIEQSKLGLIRKDTDFSTNLELVSVSKTLPIEDEYQLKIGKKREIKYLANRKVYRFSNSDKQVLEIVFQVSNDGVAFRYFMPGDEEMKYITEELTSFNLPDSSRAWLQPCADAKSGWSRTNPSYEEN